MSTSRIEKLRDELQEQLRLELQHAANASRLRNSIVGLMRKVPNGAFVEATSYTGTKRFRAVVQTAHCNESGTALKYELRLTRADGEIAAGRNPVFVSEDQIVRIIQKP